jgi:hypothetical protein
MALLTQGDQVGEAIRFLAPIEAVEAERAQVVDIQRAPQQRFLHAAELACMPVPSACLARLAEPVRPVVIRMAPLPHGICRTVPVIRNRRDCRRSARAHPRPTMAASRGPCNGRTGGSRCLSIAGIARRPCALRRRWPCIPASSNSPSRDRGDSPGCDRTPCRIDRTASCRPCGDSHRHAGRADLRGSPCHAASRMRASRRGLCAACCTSIRAKYITKCRTIWY